MTIRRVLCIAAVFCLLWTAAAADGNGYGNSYNYGTPVNIMQQSARPYHWESQIRNNGSEMTFKVDQMLDGYRQTWMEHVCWNNESLDEIPEITFYFANATIKDIWMRNAYDSTDALYNQLARPYFIQIAVWVANEEIPRGTYTFKLSDFWDSTLVNGECYDGYRLLSLPQKFENVTKIGLFIKGWHAGDEAYRSTRYILHISDMAFLPDSLGNLYGSWIYDQSYNGGGYYWTPVPTLVPVPVATPTPQPAVTPAPFTGLIVTTKERLATRSGPGTNYTETGSYFQQGVSVKAISSAYDQSNSIWWVQVELSYNGEMRRVYTGVKRLEMAATDVPVEEVECEATVIRSVYGYWGPGYGYSMYGSRIPAGTTGTVWRREAAYAQFEYFDTSVQQFRRVWVPENALEDDAVG